MTENILIFPAYLYRRGYYYHRGMKFRTLEAMVDGLSQKDYERSLKWEATHMDLDDVRPRKEGAA